ncbi:protocadherin gamma-A6-like [Mercenaria mercenaria]|uniref:protocadherin gamma-A6-like n=1 Tax=Mercenaria mercenaria TaxID=6596 RepID=UPI00234E6078|nr:protocadherin gamma-A6-like [Mercenaria mercenaria]
MFSTLGLAYLSYIMVIFLLKEANTAAPVFTFPSVNVDLPENLIVGGPVTTLTADDADGDRIDYFLVSINPRYGDELFNVAVTGEVTTKGSLDYEKDQEFVLVVRASANDEVAEQTIYVHVLNVNEAPEFEGDLIGATADNYASAGFAVTYVEAIDPDKTTDIIYTITDGNIEGDFAIHQTTGLVSVATGQMLNKTEIRAYALTIEAADSGQPPKTGTTTLIIGICNSSHRTTTTITRVMLILLFIFSSAV